MATITGIKKEKVLEVIRRYKMAVEFDVLQFGDIFSIQINGNEVIGLTEEGILYLHNKYRQAYKKPCMDDLEERIRVLEDELILKDDEYSELEDYYNNLEKWALWSMATGHELESDNYNLRAKCRFLGDELSEVKQEYKELKDDYVAKLEENWELKEKVKALQFRVRKLENKKENLV